MSRNPVKQSPIAVLTSAEASAAAVVAFLVAHGIIPAGIAKTYGVYFVVGYVVLFGVVKWWHVVPWAKAQDMAAALEDGRLPDADVARLLAGVGDVVDAAFDNRNGSGEVSRHAPL